MSLMYLYFSQSLRLVYRLCVGEVGQVGMDSGDATFPEFLGENLGYTDDMGFDDEVWMPADFELADIAEQKFSEFRM